jgi:hypothetical protein
MGDCLHECGKTKKEREGIQPARERPPATQQGITSLLQPLERSGEMVTDAEWIKTAP